MKMQATAFEGLTLGVYVAYPWAFWNDIGVASFSLPIPFQGVLMAAAVYKVITEISIKVFPITVPSFRLSPQTLTLTTSTTPAEFGATVAILNYNHTQNETNSCCCSKRSKYNTAERTMDQPQLFLWTGQRQRRLAAYSKETVRSKKRPRAS